MHCSIIGRTALRSDLCLPCYSVIGQELAQKEYDLKTEVDHDGAVNQWQLEAVNTSHSFQIGSESFLDSHFL